MCPCCWFSAHFRLRCLCSWMAEVTYQEISLNLYFYQKCVFVVSRKCNKRCWPLISVSNESKSLATTYQHMGTYSAKKRQLSKSALQPALIPSLYEYVIITHIFSIWPKTTLLCLQNPPVCLIAECQTAHECRLCYNIWDFVITPFRKPFR